MKTAGRMVKGSYSGIMRKPAKAVASAIMGAALILPLSERSASAQDKGQAPSAETPKEGSAPAAPKAEEKKEASLEEQFPDDFKADDKAGSEGTGSQRPASDAKEPSVDAKLTLTLPAQGAAAETKAAAYDDPSLGPMTETSISGRRRSITLAHNWDVGGSAYSNEAGSSYFGHLRYRLGQGTHFKGSYASVSGGSIFMGDNLAYPFGTLSVKPRATLGSENYSVSFNYYGRGTFTNLNSTFYTYHGAGGGISAQVSDRVRVRAGLVSGGGVSFPKYDDIYLAFSTGASAEFDKSFLIYAAPTFYMAAPSPIQTAYFGYYRPQFQDVNVGAQTMISEYTARIFADFGRLNTMIGGRITRDIDFSEDVAGDLWVGTGANTWHDVVGGRTDFMMFAGANIVLGGRKVNTTASYRIEHMNKGGVPQVETDVRNRGIYGFGRSGNPMYDDPINDAKQRMVDYDNYSEFVGSYANSSQDQVILIGRWMGAFMQQVAYANDAMEKMTSFGFNDPEVKRIASSDHGVMYAFLQRYVDWYESHDTPIGLPADLKSGIAVCAGIHSLVGSFYEANGIPTLVASVNARGGPHVVAIGMPEQSTVLVDYGDGYYAPPNSFDQTIRYYGRAKEAYTFRSQLFKPEPDPTVHPHYIGTYITGEGRLVDQTFGMPVPQLLLEDYLGVK